MGLGPPLSTEKQQMKTQLLYNIHSLEVAIQAQYSVKLSNCYEIEKDDNC